MPTCGFLLHAMASKHASCRQTQQGTKSSVVHVMTRFLYFRHIAPKFAKLLITSYRFTQEYCSQEPAFKAAQASAAAQVNVPVHPVDRKTKPIVAKRKVAATGSPARAATRPAVSNVGPAKSNVGPAVGNVGPAVGNVEPAKGKLGPAVGQVGLP